MAEKPMNRDEILKELRARYQWLERFTDDELQEISFCADEGSLAETDQYVDLSDPERGPISAKAGDNIPPGSCYVSKHDAGDALWDKLVMHE